MAFTKVRGRGVTTTDNYTVGVITATKFVGPITGGGGGINVGVLTATELDVNGNGNISGNLVVEGNLTANGDFTTLNTTLREVELLKVNANSSTTAGIITQTGAGDILNLFDGTTEVLTVTDGGKVGVGLTDPSTILHLKDDTNDCDLTVQATASGKDARINLYGHSGGVSQIRLGDEADGNVGLITYDHSDNSLQLRAGDYERLRITSAGKVGIGSTIPGTEFDVLGSGTVANFKGTGGNAFIGLLDVDAGAGYGYIGSDGGALVFQTPGDSYSTKLQITSAGDINIHNRTAASSTDPVTVDFGGQYTPDASITHQNLKVKLFSNSSNNDAGGLTMGQSGVSYVASVGAGHLFYTAPSAVDTLIERLRITHDGKVGINADNPNSLLEVRGTAGTYTNGVTVFTGNTTHSGSNAKNGIGLYSFGDALKGGLSSNLLYSNSSTPSQSYATRSSGQIEITNTTSASKTSEIKFGGYYKGTTTFIERLRISSGGNVQVNGGAVHLDANGEFAIFEQDTALAMTDSSKISMDFASNVARIRSSHNGSGSNAVSRPLAFYIGSSEKLKIDTSGHILPGAADTQDLGSTSKEFRNLYLGNSGKAFFGSAQELSLYHDGNNSYLKGDANAGLVSVQGQGNVELFAWEKVLIRVNAGESAVICNNNSSVDLYYNANVHTTPKLKTSEVGVTVHGEVAATQDYPDFRPTLDLNFAAVKKLDSRITYSRVGPASYVDQFGKVVLAGENTPKFDHDPMTRESKGLLIEESRTNQWLQSVTLAAYVTGGNLQQSTLANAGTSTKDPTGGYDATKMAATATGGAHSIYKNFTSGSNGNVHTFSCWVKAAGADYARIYVDSVGGNMGGPGVTFSTGNTWNVSASGVATQTTTSAVEYPNGWWRLSTTGSFSNRNDYYCHIDIEGGEGDISYTGNGSNGIYVWGVQFEKGGFPTSYIPTRGSTLTRAADQVTISGSDFTDFYNDIEGTFVVSHSILSEVPNGENCYVFEVSDGGSTHVAFRYNDVNSSFSNKPSFHSVYNSGLSASMNATGTYTRGAIVKGAMTAKHNSFKATWNGEGVQTDTSGSVFGPAATGQLAIGRYHPSAGYELNGHIQRIMYWPKQLPSDQLRTLTS